MTIVYLRGLCSLLERQQVCRWAAEGTLLVPAPCTGAELGSGVRGFFVGPTIAPARMCSHGSLYLCPLFWRVCTPCSWSRECCTEGLLAQQSLHLLPFFLVLYLNVLNHILCCLIPHLAFFPSLSVYVHVKLESSPLPDQVLLPSLNLL